MDKNTPSVARMFLDRVAKSGPDMAYQFPKGEADWQSITWQETHDRVRAVSMGLQKRGIGLEDRVAILCSTRLEWILADLGINCAGAACTTIYPSNTSEECAYIVNDSGTKAVFAENDDQVKKLQEVRDELKDVAFVVVMEGSASDDGWVLTLADLEAEGAEHHSANPDLFEETVGKINREHLATLIYTSGTTGRPKGVELTNDCWVYEAEALDEIGVIIADDHQYLWLPLSHSFGKLLEVVQLAIGFSTTVDGRIPKLVENLAVIKPTFMAAAPRIFEKVYNKVVQGVEAGSPLKQKIFRFAVRNGMKVSKLRQAGKEPGGLLAMKFKIADALVFSKLRDRFGGRIRFFVSGSAPLSREMAEFFHAAGVLILEGYGLTETSAFTFVNRPDSFKFGTVGMAAPGTEVKLDPADGEILIRGRGVMRGYHNLPDVTSETLTEDGWLRTGDIGELDAAGRLKITDRKKDLIKTSGGKYVAPQKLEASLKAGCAYLSQVVVHGNARNFCTALVTLDEEGIVGWATDNGKGGASIADLAKDADVNQMVQDAVDNLNGTLASYETIKKFAIVAPDFSVENGLLTASLKVKRKVVESTYKEVLDGFYQGSIAST
jgi:long-chain acyl-CoA synthetase